MTNVEILQQDAIKILEAKLLDKYESEFVEKIRHYSKKLLKKLTSNQYIMLETIVEKYKNRIDT